MWITKDSQLALFRVSILPERRWSIQGKDVKLITEAELVNASMIFAIVYHLPKKLANTCIDENTPPMLHVYGKYSKLGFCHQFELLQHEYTLQHDPNLVQAMNVSTSSSVSSLATQLQPATATTTTIFLPICGVAQELQFCFTNITDKPSFHHHHNNNNNDDDNSLSLANQRQTDDDEDFGIIEIYGYSLASIPAPRAVIPMLNLSTFFQYKLQQTDDVDIQRDCKLLMTAAECDTLCGFVSIQSRYFNQAKELLTRAKKHWLTLYHTVKLQRIDDCTQKQQRHPFLRHVVEKCEHFKHNALKLEILIAYIMNEHNDLKAQIESIVNMLNVSTLPATDKANSDALSEQLLPLQIISKHSKSLIQTLLITCKDHNEFIQLASYKNIYFIVEKLGCNIKHEICDILCEIFEFHDANNSNCNTERSRIQCKPLHIQSIVRQLMMLKVNICDSALHLISDCNFEIVTSIFNKLLIANWRQIIKLDSTKLAYVLRIFELCTQRLRCTPNITESMLVSLVGLMYHSSARVRTICISIWTMLMVILPHQLLHSQPTQTAICKWFKDMVINTDLKRHVQFPQNTNTEMASPTLKTSNGRKSILKQQQQNTDHVNNDSNENEHDEHNGDSKAKTGNKNRTLLIKLVLNMINKACEVQISWNNSEHRHAKHAGLLSIKQHINDLCNTLSERIRALLGNSNDIESHFDAFRCMLQSLDYLSCAINDFQVLDELIMDVLVKLLAYLKTSSPSLMMLRICVEFIEYINIADSPHNKFVDVSLQILQQFHRWIPHSIHDETFVLASKLIDINYAHLSHDDICCIVQSLLSKYTLQSTISQELQHKVICKIYQRIQSANHEPQNQDTNLFKLVTKILVFDAADFKDPEEMSRYFDFGAVWLQHHGMHNIYLHDFNLLFPRIITIFNNVLFKCKSEQIVNLSTDIVTSIALHFSTAISKYTQSDANNVSKIAQILSKMSAFYMNALEIELGDIQFHTIQNITFFLHSILLCSNKFGEHEDKVYTQCVGPMISRLLELSLSSNFTNITDLCMWSICNFYYEIARYNASNSGDRNDNHNDDNNTDSHGMNGRSESNTASATEDEESITVDLTYLRDSELIVQYAEQMAQSPDYKLRRWSGILIFLRFYLINDSAKDNNQTNDKEYASILQQLLLDFDECVQKPLSSLCQIQHTEDIIQYLETSDLLSRPKRLLSSNPENEILMEGRSDTASVNQARLKTATHSNDNKKFPGLIDVDDADLKIIDVEEEVDDIEDISDDDELNRDDEEELEVEDEDDEEEDTDSAEESNKENNESMSNPMRLQLPRSKHEHKSAEEPYDSTSSEENTSSASMSPSSQSSDVEEHSYLKKKIDIPLLPLDQINLAVVQTNLNTEPKAAPKTHRKTYSPQKCEQVVEASDGGQCNEDIIQTPRVKEEQQADVDVDEVVETNIVENEHRGLEDEEEMIDDEEEEEEEEELDMNGMDADDEREDGIAPENVTKFKDRNIWLNEDNDYITYKRGETEPDENVNGTNLKYIDSFLQSISTMSIESHDDQSMDADADDVCVNIHDEDTQYQGDHEFDAHASSEREQSKIEYDESISTGTAVLNLDEFRRSELSDFLPHIPKITHRQKGWWMKYLEHEDDDASNGK